MSKFKTTIPVDLDGVLSKLPKGSAVLGITLREDKKAVEVVWDHDQFRTPYTFPVDCPDPENPPVTAPTKPEPEPAPASGQEADSVSQPEPVAADAAPVSGQGADSPSQPQAPAADAPARQRARPGRQR